MATMRRLFMIFTTAGRSFKIFGRHYCPQIQPLYRRTTYKVTPEVANEAIRRLQRCVFRQMQDPHFIMSQHGNKANNNNKAAAPEPPMNEAQFAAQQRNNNKPDSNCRSCNDFKSWSKQQRLIANAQNAKEKHLAAAEKLTVQAAEVEVPRDDCPLDKARLGVSTWGLLHTMAAFYSDNPTDREKRDMTTFFEVLSRLYPCEFCAKDFRSDLVVNPVNVNSQKDLALWLCKFHNRVNYKLGKPLFDCSTVNERWRDGWLDGSCD